MHARRLAAVMAGLGLAGAGVAVGQEATGPSPEHLQIDSVGCAESGPMGSHRVHGSCTYLLTDGRRFRCPLSFSNRRETPAALEQAKACRPLKPIPVPRAWHRVFHRLYAVQACLRRHGITSRGGPYLDGPRRRSTPIGELVVSTRTTPALIAFYTSRSAAARAEPTVLHNVRRGGGAVDRRGSVIVAWTAPPERQLRATVDSCAF